MPTNNHKPAGVDERGFYVTRSFSNKDHEEVQQMLRTLTDPEDTAEVVERDDDHVVLKIRPDIPGL